MFNLSWPHRVVLSLSNLSIIAPAAAAVRE